MKKIKVPHTLVLLFMMMILALLTTYILPQGSFDTLSENGRDVVVPGSYQTNEESVYLKPWHLLTVVPRALADSQAIIFFIFIIGGALAVVKSTGAINALIGKLLQKFSKTYQWLIFIPMLLFAVASGTIGMAEEYIPFVGVLIAMSLALKLDSITAIGIMVVGYGIGYGTAAINPFTVMIAQDVAQVKPTSGIWYRLVLFAPFFAVGYWHVRSYAIKIKANPKLSLMEGVTSDVLHQEESSYPPLSKVHLLVLAFTVLAIVAIVYGISELSGWHWYLVEIGAVFLGLTLLTMIVTKIKPDKTAATFIVGAAELTGTALLIGFARSIALILEDGQVLHTIVHYLSIPLQQSGAEISSVGMYFIQSVMNFFIPSGSGQAYVTMPLMAPIADLTGVSRQIAVLAYQFGDGFTNMLVPTNAVLMGILGIAGIPYDRWFRFIIGLMIKLWILGAVALIIAVWVGYQ
ncbi:MAG: TIGR00366 family protein [Cyclobacteriaceae bacterium]|nr:TIGR00366 family protein [Cyclobacteriaceae bacterium]